MVVKRRTKNIRRTTGKGGNFRPTKSGAGMTKKGVRAYRKKNPGSKLKTAVTGIVKKGSKAAKRRKSYCARSAGQLKLAVKYVQLVKLGLKELLIHTLQLMQIWLHLSIAKILTTLKDQKRKQRK